MEREKFDNTKLTISLLENLKNYSFYASELQRLLKEELMNKRIKGEGKQNSLNLKPSKSV